MTAAPTAQLGMSNGMWSTSLEAMADSTPANGGTGLVPRPAKIDIQGPTAHTIDGQRSPEATIEGIVSIVAEDKEGGAGDEDWAPVAHVRGVGARGAAH